MPEPISMLLSAISSEIPKTMRGDAEQNLAVEDALFQALEAGSKAEGLRVWQSAAVVVVVGRSGAIGRDVEEEACAADGVRILRRISGGGAVVLGPGCINYSMLLSLERHPELRDVRASYRWILGYAIRALAVTGLA